ncbi:MAG: DNA polymerase III subunit epsilon [Peptococcaceae bacterium]|nr:DNA polymerase III subunit epsilon [Peptococcaceae bacterium]
MFTGFVALDLETTGLDPELDSIIEVGMVKVRDGEIIDTFHTLVDPGKKLPLKIRKLTGINELMLAGAPPVDRIRDDLAGFIDGEIILGHNIAFDMGFIESSLGKAVHNPAFDTLELARVIMPSAGSYRLSDLCSLIGLEVGESHRALEDARAVVFLFQHLARCINRLDGHTVLYLESLLKKAGSPWGNEITGAGGFLAQPVIIPAAVPRWRAGGQFHHRDDNPEKWGYVDPDQVKELMSEKGLLADKMPSFQYRCQQAEMAAEVARAFNEKKYLLAEAGTGTGKSLAYLVPSILWAAGGGPRVVISTRTVNLQEQLWYKDIPQIGQCLGVAVKTVLAKGRSNYICLRRWNGVLTEGLWSDQEAYFYARVLVWINETESGDKVELNLNSQQEEMWLNICADSDNCLGGRCRYYTGSCFVTRARREAESAGIIVTNHALLFSDIKTGHKVLPAYGPLIIDEAHHLEDAATEQLGRQVSRSDIRRWLISAGKTITRCWELAPPSESGAWVDQLVSLKDCLNRLRAATDVFFALLKDLTCRDSCAGKGNQADLVLKGEDLGGEKYRPVMAACGNLIFEIKSFLAGFRRIIGLMQAWAIENDSWEEKLRDVMQLAGTGEDLLAALEFNISCADDSFVYWVSVSGHGQWSSVSLHSSPVRVGGLLYDHLFSTREAVVMTSATLTVDGSFDFFTERVGIDRVYGSRVVKRQIESPFVYEKQSLLCLVSDLPAQGFEAHRHYFEAIASAIVDLVRAGGEKTLVLFTSHRVLREVYGLVRERLEEEDICTLGHNLDGNRLRLVEEFKTLKKAVLMGAASFWEGIDIPGEALTSVIIVKLPFPSPSVPVIRARIEDLEKSGRNSFYDYCLPLSVIRFKQGFGRLIRSEKDRGAVVVLDRRIVDRDYGRHFLDSLPVEGYFRGSLKRVVKKLADWYIDMD